MYLNFISQMKNILLAIQDFTVTETCAASPVTWYIIGGMMLLCMGLTGFMAFRLYKNEKRHQAELKEREEQIYGEQVNILINMSHELRTPLTLIMAPLKRLLKGMDSDNANYATLGRIYRQARRMSGLIDMVLDLRRMEAGRTTLMIENLDFNRWLNEATEDIVNEEHAEGIEILHISDPAIGNVDFDRRRCDTIMTNILINAIKHSRPGDQIVVRTRLTEEGMVRTSISDQGPGLGDIDRTKLFTRFYQSNSERYGSGIGLSYSRILAELHGGNIGAEDNDEKGATFWWEIPVNSTNGVSSNLISYINELIGNESVAEMQTPENDNFSTAGMRLMLVDDSQDLLDFLCEALNGEFAEITTAQSGNSALAHLSAGRLPDIIVSDVNMPDGDGCSLCKAISQSTKYNHIPVILLAARGEQQNESNIYRAGAEALLPKPFETETLLELLRSVLRRKNEIRKKYLDTHDKVLPGYGSKEEGFIIQLNRIISEHMSDPELDQQLLCRELGVSRATLYNKMKAITGASTKEYITHIRLKKAKSLMETTEITIAEISDMTGFTSQSYFSTAFKNYTGLTPSQYKKSLKNTSVQQ